MSVIAGIGPHSSCLSKHGFVFRGAGENPGSFCIGCPTEKATESARSSVYFTALAWLVLNLHFC